MGDQGDIKRKVVLLIMLLSVVLLAINLIPRFLGDDDFLILPEDLEYRVEVEAEGIIVKEEQLYYSIHSGEIYRFAGEGERVRVGQEIADILVLEDTTELKSELSRIENMIDFYENLKPNSDGEDTKISSVTQILLDILIDGINNDDKISVQQTRESLGLQMNSMLQLNGYEIGAEITLDDLKNSRQELLGKISRHDRKISSRHSGIVSYDIDGWETHLSPDGLDSITLDDFQLEEYQGTQSSNPLGRPVLKVVDDYRWYLALSLEQDQVFEVGDYLNLTVMDDGSEVLTDRLPIIDIMDKNSDKIYILRSNRFLERVYDKRHVDIRITVTRMSSFRIPTKALTTNEGLQGVMVKEFYGVVNFRPVDVIHSDENLTYVSKGDSSGYIEVKDKSYRTISVYSEIVIRPDIVQVGDIIK